MLREPSQIIWPDEGSRSWEMIPDFAWRREIFRGMLLGLAVVAVLLLHQKFSPGFELIDDDAVSSWQPIFTDFVRQLGEGHVPVWSHHTSCGFPLLGWPQPSFVYPPMWLAHGFCRLIGFEAGEFYIATLMHFFVAATASYVYLRRFGVHPLAATAASLAATFSGILLGLGSCWPTYVFSAAYWPMVFLALEEIRVARSGWFWAGVLGLLGGLAFLYADLLLMVKFTLFTGLYFLLRVERANLGRSIAALALASAIALVIGLGQLFPSIEIIANSARMGLGSNDFYTAPPRLWLGYVFPFQKLPWESFVFSHERVAGGFFVGPCALLGLMFAVRWFRPLRGPHRAFVVLVILYFSLAVGSIWPPNEVLQKLPVFNAIRWPMRWLFEASCALALLSGFGLHLAFRDLIQGRGRRLVFGFVGLVGLVMMALWPAPPGMERLTALMFGVWMIGLISLIAFTVNARATSVLTLGCVWTAIAMVGNIPVAQETRMARMTHLLDDPLTVGRDTQDRVLFLARHSDLLAGQKEGNLARLFPHQLQTRSVLGYVYRPPSQGWMTGFELDGLIYENEPDLMRRFLGPKSTILATLRVGHVVVFKANKALDDACAAHPQLKLESESALYRIYRNEGFKEPAFLIRELKPEDRPGDLTEMGTRLRMPDEAFVDPNYAGPRRFAGDGTVTNFREHHGDIAFDVDAADEAFVVVTTTLSPRWRATVDGEPATLVRVNGSFMGLRVPAGQHVVRIEYRPTDHLVFLAISGVALALTTIVLVAAGLRSVG
jgi:hypothetical protein